MGVFDKLNHLKDEAIQVTKEHSRLEEDIRAERRSKTEYMFWGAENDLKKLRTFMDEIDAIGFNTTTDVDVSDTISLNVSCCYGYFVVSAYQLATDSELIIYEAQKGEDGEWRDWVKDSSEMPAPWNTFTLDLIRNWDKVVERLTDKLVSGIKDYLAEEKQKIGEKEKTLESIREKERSFEKSKEDFGRE